MSESVPGMETATALGMLWPMQKETKLLWILWNPYTVTALVFAGTSLAVSMPFSRMTRRAHG
jgi:hypothetical protein